MEVLLATDLAEGAKRTASLVDSLQWPKGTRIEVLAVGPTVDGELASRYDALYTRVREGVDLELATAARVLERDGREIVTSFQFGRPASLIVEEASRIAADLVIVGSHAHGTLAVNIPGSVAAEVIDHASAPVLVARTPLVRRILLAADGSDCAREAEEVVATWPILSALPVLVLSVADLSALHSALDPFGTGMVVADAYQQLVDEVQSQHEGIAREAAARLGARGVHATPIVRQGAPAREIVETACAMEADLIVTGTRGRTGLTRLLLGSVARGVLAHASASVLTVRRTPHPGAGRRP
jgi:nucleotide-binding universal stress UspA family protein